MEIARPKRAGAALILTLSLLVLITGLLLAFLSRVQTQRKVEDSSARRAQAEVLARTGLEYVRLSLAREITDPANSEELTVSTTPARYVYRPLSAAKMWPAKTIQPALNTLDTQSHMQAIIKQSVAAFDPRCSTLSTTTADRNGVSIDFRRWVAPYFHYSGGGFTTAAQAPNWLYFSEDGPSQTPPYLGRVAFNVYHLDGLLDISNAGYPAALNGNRAAINALKNSVAGADLSQAWFYSSADPRTPQALVAMRSPVSSQTAEEFYQAITSNTNGHLTPAQGDTHFLGRLDLLRFIETSGIGIQKPAAGDLTAWTRALDAPSWQPPVPTAANPFAPTLVHSADATLTSYHDDATAYTYPVQRGDALVQRRFSLARLRWLDAAWPGGAPLAAIQSGFGLTPEGPRRWRYNEARIRSLAEISGREPNFFELLKAAIVQGSLGEGTPTELERDLHILQIGAAAIDNATSGNLPTELTLHDSSGTAHTRRGVKDLPYLHGIRFRQLVTTNATGVPQRVDHLALPILWNPHAPALTAASQPEIRLRVVGNVETPEALFNPDTGDTLALQSRLTSATPVAERTLSIGPSPNGYRTPGPVLAGPTAPARPDSLSGSYAAFWLAGEAATPGHTLGPKTSGTAQLSGFELILEYFNGADWVAYDTLAAPSGHALALSSTLEAAQTHSDSAFTGPETPYLLKPDPRTPWGLTHGKTAATPQTLPNETTAAPFAEAWAPATTFPALADPDGKTRPNDHRNGVEAPLSTVAANAASPARTPLLLRPYLVVAELGSAFRGQPWKTLDFASPTSGDAALLDYFATCESPHDGVVAGRIGLNTTRPGPLVSLLIHTALRHDGSVYISGRPKDTAGPFTSSDERSLNYSRALFPATSGLRGSPADLVGLDQSTGLYKQEREALARALGSSGQTRTWNFFIDLIAQSGRMVPAASTTPGDFVVQGQARLWMQVAVDRLTGRIVASHVEAYEE